MVSSNDKTSKHKAKLYSDKRRKARNVTFEVGDRVYMKQSRTNKHMTNFSEQPFEVTETKGSMISVTSEETGQQIARDQSWFKEAVKQEQVESELNEQAFETASPQITDHENLHTEPGQERTGLSSDEVAQQPQPTTEASPTPRGAISKRKHQKQKSVLQGPVKSQTD